MSTPMNQNTGTALGQALTDTRAAKKPVNTGRRLTLAEQLKNNVLKPTTDTKKKAPIVEEKKGNFI